MFALKRRGSRDGKKADRNLYRGIRVVSLRGFVRCQTNLPPGAISARTSSPFSLLARSWLAHTIAKRLLYPSHSRGLRGALRDACNCSTKLSVPSKICSFSRNDQVAKLTSSPYVTISSVSIAAHDRRKIDRSLVDLAIELEQYELAFDAGDPRLSPQSHTYIVVFDFNAS